MLNGIYPKYINDKFISLVKILYLICIKLTKFLFDYDKLYI